MKRSSLHLALVAFTVAAVVAACGGGGGGGGDGSAASGGPAVSGAQPGAMSSGTITAFGSVFVNGHEFNIASAHIIDDDDPTATPAASTLEVGMSVDVKAAHDSNESHPSAQELHVHPLVRGYVDASNTTTATLTVMGQKVQLTAATNFSDRRACLAATTSPCAAVTGQSGLASTTGTGGSAVAGSYVTVHGYLFDGGSGGTNIVATLVSVRDAPAAPALVAFKAEGTVSATSGASVTIGGLSVDLSAAKCFAPAPVACSGAFSVGQVVSAVGATAPALPATTFKADAARPRRALLVQSAGTVVEIEGKVASVTASPAGFVIRGIPIDASALPAGSLPAVGDIVEVTGTVASDGTSVAASAIKMLHAAHAATVAFEGDVTSVTPGSSADTYVLKLLGQTIAVDASTRLADRTTGDDAQTANPFNITTFAKYLAASASQHVLVRTQADASGALTALSVTIVRASTVSGVGGVVDATPAPVNAAPGSGKPSTFSVHGLAVSADPAAIVALALDRERDGTIKPGTAAAIAAGDRVLVLGTFASGGITVAAPLNLRSNIVVDFGPPRGDDHDDF